MRVPAIVLGAASALLLGACGSARQEAVTPVTGSAALTKPAAPPAAASAGDPCTLLEPQEVEAVLGPLAGPPYRTREVSDEGEPADDGDACRYDGRDLRSLTVAVSWTDGSMVMRMAGLPGGAVPAEAKGQIPKGLLPEGVSITGEWDEATTIGCCRLLALRGDSTVALDYAGSRASGAQAVKLLNAALLRLDKPLVIDGRGGMAAAEQRLAARPAKRPVCQLVPRAAAEAILGPLNGDPHGDDKTCLYTVNARASFDTGQKATSDLLNMMASHTQVGDLRLVVKWRNGFRELRSGVAMIGETEKLLKRWEGSAQTAAPAQVSGGIWDDAWQSSGGFMAVKKDVMISVEMPSMLSEADKDKRRELVARAINQL